MNRDDPKEDCMKQRPTKNQIRELARQSPLLHEGELEMGHKARISASDATDENGAYVQTWMWVSFAGTKYDREA